MAIDFKIDTVMMTTQPSRVEYDPPKAVLEEMADGSVTASKRTYGKRALVTWGVDAAPTAVMAELRTKLNGLLEHAISFNDKTGTNQAFNAVADCTEPSFTLIPGYLYGAITVEFRQRGA